MENWDNYFKVYIIESPSANDLLHGRCEGTSLTSIFKLEDIPYEYYLAINKDTVKSALELIKEDMLYVHYEEMRECFFFPIIHLSCHGNEDCIAFSSGDSIKWNELNQIINDMELNLAFDEGGTINPLSLSMSSCCGLYAIFADREEHSVDKSPFAFVLGHEESIRWDDALIAFATYYHNLIKKELTMTDSVRCMNNSINNADFFKSFHSHDAYNLLSNG